MPSPVMTGWRFMVASLPGVPELFSSGNPSGYVNR
jgi:hypothetical protein